MANNTHIFVNGLDLDGPVRTGLSKQFHKKSRTGCQKCRARRVKCNEAKPICRSCEDHGWACVYDRQSPSVRGSPTGQTSTPQSIASTSTPITPDEFSHESVTYGEEPRESRQRRLIELELFQHYITETAPSVQFDNETSFELFSKAIPRMAPTSDGLLYSVLAFAALHQSKASGSTHPSSPTGVLVETARDQHERYVQLAFQHHAQELSQLNPANIDVLILTANIMRLIAFVVMSEREVEPYYPPVDWLRVMKSHYRIYRTGWDWVGSDKSTQISRMVQATPMVWDQSDFEQAQKRQPLEYILQVHPQNDQYSEFDNPLSWTSEVREAYESSLCHIGGVLQAINNGDSFGSIARQLVVLPVMLDEKFIAMVEEGRPRALVILAHYFSLLVLLRTYWFIEEIAVREVTAIANKIPLEWQPLMSWPMNVVQGGVIPTI